MTASAQRLESDPNVASTLEGASRELRRCNNCGGDASGNYCADCGQESSLALPTAGRFLREAAGRYVAFDGRMWRSLYALAFRPGFLTREYLGGRRRRYVGWRTPRHDDRGAGGEAQGYVARCRARQPRARARG